MDIGVDDAPVRTKASRPRSFRVARIFAALAIHAALLASTTPSPLYPLYVARWSLGQQAATSIFAIYALGTLVSLIVMSRLGDRLGDRRRVLVPALVVVCAGSLVFAAAPNVSWLLLGRLLSGIGTGAITGTATAALYDLERPHKRRHAAIVATLAFTGGAALGPILSASALALDIHPTVAPFVLIAMIATIAAGGLMLAPWPDRPPETEARLAPGPPAIPGDLQPPSEASRMPFLLAGTALCLSWMVGSMLMAVGASLASTVFGLASPALAGMVPALFQVFAGLGQFLFGRVDARRAILLGLIGLGATQAMLALGALLAALPVLLMTMPLCGLLYGAAFVGATGLVTASTPADRRTATVSRFYMIGYLSNALPVLALGRSIDAIGFEPSFLVFSGLIVGLAGLGVALTRHPALRPRRAGEEWCGAQAPSAARPAGPAAAPEDRSGFFAKL